ncbi:hypothetical protein FisN_15Hh230 [Fistulifera solaris]|uniref:Uncharacterized protein n=1 Tax=Fistulifera solaris TaxID=1519565 RepID=A0A1Z5JG69_FISSO|nr:hypothetical protein FisN_15Hh230 [Fistulifera solaris]|eukprot:GAX12751.1 hypothetical protein FisN_15Hh230 [Fistulifera solaris]
MSIEEQLLVVNDDASEEPDSSPTLSKPLAMLFAINGVTMALPATSLLYIVNTRVEMPLSLLPTYAAVSFLPFSLKPIYAVLSSSTLIGSLGRHNLISVFLLIGAVSIAATAWVHGVVGCFLIAFTNCLSNAWAEFLLGLTLLDEASCCGPFVGVTAAAFQSQAATHRNVGSLVAYLLVWLWMIVEGSSSDTHQISWNGKLNDRIVKELLLLTGLVYIVGTVIAQVWTVGTREGCFQHANKSSYEQVNSAERDDMENGITENTVSHSTAWKRTSVRLIVLLQITILLISLKQPLEKMTSFSFWILLMIALGTSWCFVIRSASRDVIEKWPRSHRTGLYLILRHAVPSVSYIMESYLYDAFAATAPAFLTVLSVWDMLVSSLASWSYGALFRNCHRDYTRMLFVIVGTTIFAAVGFFIANNLLMLLLRRDTDDENARNHVGWSVLISVLALKSLLTLTSEWKFLPDVILATTTAYISESSDDPAPFTQSASGVSNSVGLRYGSLIGCIDFGGMIGSLLAVPMVNAFGTSRENDWANMEGLITTASIATLLSGGLTILLKK